MDADTFEQLFDPRDYFAHRIFAKKSTKLSFDALDNIAKECYINDNLFRVTISFSGGLLLVVVTLKEFLSILGDKQWL